MFYWNNLNIRQKGWRLIKATLLSFSIKQCRQWNRGFSLIYWTKTKCQISVPWYQASVTKQIRYKYQRQLFGTNQYFIVNIFQRGKSCFGYKPPSTYSFPCFLNIKHSHRTLRRWTLSFCFVTFRWRSCCNSFDFVVKIDRNEFDLLWHFKG